MMTDLTDVEGIGPSYAETLQEDGYEDAVDLAEADPAELDELLDRADGETLVEAAQAEVETDEETAGDLLEIAPGFTDVQENYLLRALIDQATAARRTNNHDQVEVIEQAIASVKDGEPYHLTLEQCSQAYTGTNQLEQELRSDRNINDLVSEVRRVKQVFQQARQDNLPEA